MKIIIAVIGLAFFIQTICVFEALGQTEASPPNCSEYNSTSCCSVPGCKLYSCSDQNQTKCADGTNMTCSNETLQLQNWCPVTNNTENDGVSPSTNTSTTSTQATTTTAIKGNTTDTTTNGAITTEPATSTNSTVATTETPTSTAVPPTTGNLTTGTATTPTTTGTLATATPTTGSTSGVPGNPAAGDESGRHFDAASFIGGIVLCLGLGVIAFIGLKYYRSRSQQNYRTL